MAKLEFFGDKCILRLGSNLKIELLKEMQLIQIALAMYITA